MRKGDKYICDDCLASPYMPDGHEHEAVQQFKGVDVCAWHLQLRRTIRESEDTWQREKPTSFTSNLPVL